MKNLPNLVISYPEKRSRIHALFRIVTMIPFMVISYFFTEAILYTIILALLWILFTKTYPSILKNFVEGYISWYLRFTAYQMLMTDEIPSFTNEAIRMDFESPKKLRRFFPIFKWVLVLPHMIIFFVLSIFSLIFAIYSIIHIVIFNQQPRWIFHFLRITLESYYLRPMTYCLYLLHDNYPPLFVNPFKASN